MEAEGLVSWAPGGGAGWRKRERVADPPAVSLWAPFEKRRFAEFDDAARGELSSSPVWADEQQHAHVQEEEGARRVSSSREKRGWEDAAAAIEEQVKRGRVEAAMAAGQKRGPEGESWEEQRKRCRAEEMARQQKRALPDDGTHLLLPTKKTRDWYDGDDEMAVVVVPQNQNQKRVSLLLDDVDDDPFYATLCLDTVPKSMFAANPLQQLVLWQDQAEVARSQLPQRKNPLWHPPLVVETGVSSKPRVEILDDDYVEEDDLQMKQQRQEQYNHYYHHHHHRFAVEEFDEDVDAVLPMDLSD